MSLLFYGLLLCAVVLGFVIVTAALGWAEARSPRLHRWLDEHVGEEPTWGKF
jgi:hypothetical protein